MSEDITTNEGVTRREALKKGARLGGALIWTVPVVQTVGISAAAAAEPSDVCRFEIAITDVQVESLPDTGGTGVDIRVSYQGANTGNLLLSEAQVSLEFQVDGGAWQLGGFDFFGNIPTSTFASDSTDLSDVESGSYNFRLSGKYKCAASGGAFRGHDAPLPFAVFGPVVVS